MRFEHQNAEELVKNRCVDVEKRKLENRNEVGLDAMVTPKMSTTADRWQQVRYN